MRNPDKKIRPYMEDELRAPVDCEGCRYFYRKLSESSLEKRRLRMNLFIMSFTTFFLCISIILKIIKESQ